jgi:hypothetical protein
MDFPGNYNWNKLDQTLVQIVYHVLDIYIRVSFWAVRPAWYENGIYPEFTLDDFNHRYNGDLWINPYWSKIWSRLLNIASNNSKIIMEKFFNELMTRLYSSPYVNHIELIVHALSCDDESEYLTHGDDCFGSDVQEGIGFSLPEENQFIYFLKERYGSVK